MRKLRPASFLGKALRAIGSACALLLAMACGSSSQTVTAPPPARCGLEASVESSTFPNAGGSGTLRISTNRECAWSAQSSVAWVKLSPPVEGQGDGSVAFTVTGNGDPARRTAGITINDRRVEISQEGSPCSFGVSPTRETIEASGGDRTIRVSASSAQCGWTAAPDAAWITITAGLEGSGNGEVTFHVDAANGPPRSGTLTVAGERVHVEQGTGCTVSIGPSMFNVAATGGPHDVPVSSPPGCPWTAVSENSWITIRSGATGQGNGHVQFVVSANAGAARQGAVRIAGRLIQVAQATGCAYTVGPFSQQILPAGGSGVVSVATDVDCVWNATSSANWLTLSAGSATGSGAVQFAAMPNNSIARTATLTVAGQSFTLSQASPCTFLLAPPYLTYDDNGGNGAVLVIVSGAWSWTAHSTVSWIRMLSGTSGEGNGLVQFTVDANTGSARTGTVVIAGQNFSVTQGVP